MKPAIFFTTETQRAQSNDPSAPPTALASPACGWSRVDKDNPSVVVSENLCRSMLRSFRGLRVLRAFVVSALALTAVLRAQTNTFPSSGSVGVGTTSPEAPLTFGGNNGSKINFYHTANNYKFQVDVEQYNTSQFNLRFGMPDQYPGRIFQFGTISASDGSTFNSILTLLGSGNVGIGTMSPATLLDLAGSVGVKQLIYGSGGNTGYYMGFGVNLGQSPNALSVFTGSASGGSGVGSFEIVSPNSTWPYTSYTTVLSVQSSGRVGIGTTSPGYPLTVNGAVRAKEVIVDTGWSDYVFDKSYRLAPLSEVEQRINEDHHLPGIPSAQEVNEKGISVGQMQAKLLAKIEELTLHQIEQEKKFAAQQTEIARLSAELAHISTRATP